MSEAGERLIKAAKDARRQALEEAAEIAEKYAELYDVDNNDIEDSVHGLMWGCTRSIRQLMKKE